MLNALHFDTRYIANIDNVPPTSEKIAALTEEKSKDITIVLAMFTISASMGENRYIVSIIIIFAKPILNAGMGTIVMGIIVSIYDKMIAPAHSIDKYAVFLAIDICLFIS